MSKLVESVAAEAVVPVETPAQEIEPPSSDASLAAPFVPAAAAPTLRVPSGEAFWKGLARFQKLR